MLRRRSPYYEEYQPTRRDLPRCGNSLGPSPGRIDDKPVQDRHSPLQSLGGLAQSYWRCPRCVRRATDESARPPQSKTVPSWNR